MVAQGTFDGSKVVEQAGRRIRGVAGFADPRPQGAEITNIGGEVLLRRIRGGRANDEAALCTLPVGGFGNEPGEVGAGLFLHDAPGDGNAAPVRRIDEIASRQRKLARQACALVGQRILYRLNQHRLAFVHARTDRRRLAAAIERRLGRARFVGPQEPGSFQADLDEGRVHGRHHAGHAAQEDGADHAAPVLPLDGHLAQGPVLDNGDSRFAKAGINKDFATHDDSLRVGDAFMAEARAGKPKPESRV